MRKLLLMMALSLSANAFAGSNICEKVTGTLGEKPGTFIQNMGRPTSREVENINNLHNPDVIDNLIKLNYPTGFASFYYGSSSNKYILLKARLNAADFSAPLKSVIAGTVAKAIQQHGQPDETTPTNIRYYCGETGEEWVDIFRRQNTITGFEFVAYFDG